MDPAPHIGRYEVIRPLGQGGMGRVLLARDSVLGREVAIKILREDLGLPPEAREALFARMRQEARAAAAIGHPHIVTLHDMGDDPTLGLYLVLEYLQGSTLRERLDTGPLDLSSVARLGRELGDALAAAHEAGVIHRDVKPENVILSPYGAKITDFGIARLPDSTLTSVGSVLGTPAYSAPEALARGVFSPASDQFSLASTLYESLCGRRAYPGEDALAIAARIATEAPPLLPPGTAEPWVAVRIDAVLTRAMAKDPARRYPTCRTFGDALAQAIEARQIDTPRISESPPKSIVPRATRRLHNLIGALAALVIVALFVFGRARGEGMSLRRVADDFALVATRRSPAPPATGDAPSAHRHPRSSPATAPDAAPPRQAEAPPAPRDAAQEDARVDASVSPLVLPVSTDDAAP